MSPARHAIPGTLEHFLTERYCLYAVEAGRFYRAEIHHVRWHLQDAEAEIARNTMAAAAGIELPNERPLLHFVRLMEVLVWGPERLKYGRDAARCAARTPGLPVCLKRASAI